MGWKWALALSLAFGSMAIYTACADDTEEPVEEAPQDDEDRYICPQECPAGTERIEDSATSCGFRCEVVSGETPDDPPADCDRECGEGFERVSAPQTECGFTCLPEPMEDGSSFDNDVNLLDMGGDEDEVEPDAVDEDAQETDADGEADA